MLGRIVAITLAIGGAMASNAVLAQGNPVANVVTGIGIATGVIPIERQAPLHEYIVRENRPSYQYDRYSDDVVVGRELPVGSYQQSYPVPSEYGVPEHHYTIINGHPVIFHPVTRRIIYVR